MNPAYDLEAEIPVVSQRAVTEMELWANRRRFRLFGVPVMSGSRSQWHPLDINARHPLHVRPAIRLDDRKSFDAFIDRTKEIIVDVLEAATDLYRSARRLGLYTLTGRIAQALCAAAVVAVAVTQIIHHFSP